jgi:cobalt-zinc-cadmium resistance protein CzcA
VVAKLIAWSIDNTIVVLLLVAALAVGGTFAFQNVNVEAYPDPAPAIVEVVAQYPGASAEEVERQVTIPLEASLAGMPGLTYTRSKSLFGLSHLRNQFDYGADWEKAKQEVINRMQMAVLPANVQPQISPQSPTGEIYRYTLSNPKDALGRPIYELRDLKSLQDFTLDREFKRVPRIVGTDAMGGEVKRYEVHPDPELLARYGISLSVLQQKIAASNRNASGEYLKHGSTVQVVRGLGLVGRGEDPMPPTFVMNTPEEAARWLRAEEVRRLKEIRHIVLTSINNQPILVDNVVDGGPLLNSDGTPRVPDFEFGRQGVVVGHATRLGRVGITRPVRDGEGREVLDAKGERVWELNDDVVQGVVLLRKGAESLPALYDLKAKVDELNSPGHVLPGVKIEPNHDRTELIGVTTETVQENLLLGLCLVAMILLLFLNNVRVALIVAINIPLALLFAVGTLYARGKSANLLSIGAVDFGIIVDSTVIVVESVYRRLATEGASGRSLKRRVLDAAHEVGPSMFVATLIMVCALLPLFSMTGPEGQLFSPMADTYAFALGGALLLALTLSPVLCVLLLKNVRDVRDNILVRTLKAVYMVQLRVALQFRWAVLAAFLMAAAITGVVAANIGREFMPELEEGNLWVRGVFPVNISFEESSERSRRVMEVLERYPEVELATSQMGRPDDGTDSTTYSNIETFVPLKPQDLWPAVAKYGRPRTKGELVADMNEELTRLFPGVDWDFSQNIRDNVMEALSGVKGENAVKIFGPDLGTLENLAAKVKEVLSEVPGVEDPGIFHTQGQSNLEFVIDRQKCSDWGASTQDVADTIEASVGGKPATSVTEGERSFDLTIRFPHRLRRDEQSILKVPVEVSGNQIVTPASPRPATWIASAGTGPSTTGTSNAPPALAGSALVAAALPNQVPTQPLNALVSPPAYKDGRPEFLRPGASTIFREQSRRFIAVKFDVRGRDLAGTVADAQGKVAPLMPPGYRTEWSGEFQSMQKAEHRLVRVFAISVVLILIIIYVAFRSVLDTIVVFGNVVAIGLGGIWALKIADLNFNISAAVGFISILGVAVMNGIILVSSFNRLRSAGMELGPALETGFEHRIRPLMMTILTAILGLLPAAFSTRIGAQSQRPLAIVVVGGMVATLILMSLVPVLYSFYGRRTPPAGASGSMAH